MLIKTKHLYKKNTSNENPLIITKYLSSAIKKALREHLFTTVMHNFSFNKINKWYLHNHLM